MPITPSRVKSAIAADMAYFALKPAEWLARLCLGLALPGQMDLVSKVYRGMMGTRRRSLAVDFADIHALPPAGDSGPQIY